jgi:excinuclease UvrABC nuclease subunit
MKVAELLPPPRLKTLFRLSAFRQVPAKPGCYALTTSEGLILYVGLAINLSVRFQQHLDNPGKTEATEFGRAFFFFSLEFDNQNLAKLERSWLNQYATMHGCRPILNKVDSPVA